MLALVDALMADYHLSLLEAFGGEMGGRRVWGFPLDLALALWPALLSRHGVDVGDTGPTSLEDSYIDGANRRRAELMACYTVID